MPLLVEKLLLKYFDSDYKGLYRALQKSGDSVSLKANSNGGLGSTFLSPLMRDALEINMDAKTVSLVAKNLVMLEEIAEKYRAGDAVNGYNKNKNKQLICLALIVRQPVTMQSHKIIRKAFECLITTYATQYGYKDQRTLNGEGGLILTLIETEKVIFEKEIKQRENEELRQKLASTVFANNTRASSESKLQDLLSASTPSYSPSPNESHSAGSNSQTPPVSLSLTPHSSSGHSISQRSLSESNGEMKISPSNKDEDIRAARSAVKEILRQMRESSLSPDRNITFQLKEIKAAQKIFFKKHVFFFTLEQLRFLSNYMYLIQRNRISDEHSFDEIRTENSRIRRFFGFRKGNTNTWQDIAAFLQTILLEQLLKHSQAERFQKLPLPSMQYNNWAKLFGRSFSRYKWATPDILKRFRETCRETPEEESPAQPTRSLSSGQSP